MTIMKLRIKGDSLRLRLTKGEVTQLDTGGVVEEKMRFVRQAPRWSIACGGIQRRTRSNASFAQGAVEVRVPEKSVHAWASSNEAKHRRRSVTR